MPTAIDAAIAEALTPSGKPTLVCCKTVIGWGAPKMAGTHDVHGAPLGADETAATRKALGWPYPPFEIPGEIRDAWDARPRGAEAPAGLAKRFDAYAAAHPDLAAEFQRRHRRQAAGRLRANAPTPSSPRPRLAANTVATRKSSQRAIEALAPLLPELLGGSADLTGSNLTNWPTCRTVSTATGGGNYIHYGVREFGMTAIDQRHSAAWRVHPVRRHLPGVLRLFAGNALRLSALMGLRRRSRSSPTTASALARTARPTSRSSTRHPAPDPEHRSSGGPCDALETAECWARRCRAAQRADLPAAVPPEPAAAPAASDGQRPSGRARRLYAVGARSRARPTSC